MSFYKDPIPLHPDVSTAMNKLSSSLQFLKLRNEVSVPLVEGYLLICEKGDHFRSRDLSRITIKSISTDRRLCSQSIHELKEGMVTPILDVWVEFIDKIEKQFLLEKEEDNQSKKTIKRIESLMDSYPESLKKPPPLQKSRHEFDSTEG